MLLGLIGCLVFANSASACPCWPVCVPELSTQAGLVTLTEEKSLENSGSYIPMGVSWLTRCADMLVYIYVWIF